jgi:hypothetical protein
MPIAIANTIPMAIPAMAPLESLGPGGAGNVDGEDVGAEDMDVENVDFEDMIAEDIVAEEEGVEKDDGQSCVGVVLSVLNPGVCGCASEVKYGCIDLTVTDDEISEPYGIEPYGIGEGYAMSGTLGIHQGRVV